LGQLKQLLKETPAFFGKIMVLGSIFEKKSCFLKEASQESQFSAMETKKLNESRCLILIFQNKRSFRREKWAETAP